MFKYYPFGLSTANSWTRENTTGNNFLYNGGTELNTTTQVYDLHYRNYDPVLGRMNQVDPLASKYGSVTPYNYAFNAPTNMNDPLGDEPNGNCSWCNPKPRPIDTGTSGGGGGGGGGNPFASLMGRSAGFFEPGWQPGSGSLSAGAFAAHDQMYQDRLIEASLKAVFGEASSSTGGGPPSVYNRWEGSDVPAAEILSYSGDISNQKPSLRLAALFAMAMSSLGQPLQGLGFQPGTREWESANNWMNGAGFVIGGASFQLSRVIDNRMVYSGTQVWTGARIQPRSITFRTPVGGITTTTAFARNLSTTLKVGGAALGVVGAGMTIMEITSGQKNLVGEGGLDLVMGAVGFIPGWGWAASGLYFGGKYLLQATGNDFWNK